MAVSDSAKVDLLYKKLFGVAKTDLPANKSPSNEAIASPSLLRGDNVWQQAASIPGTAAATAGIVQAYTGASAVQCTADTTSTPISSVYPSWKTNLADWIPSEFGSTYFVQVWVDSSGVANPTATGTQIFDSGIAGVGEWNFDYQSGVLNFIGGTIPASLTVSKVIYVVGYRYIGAKGVANFTSGLTIGNITISGNTITGNSSGISFGSNIFVGNIFYGNGSPFASSNYGNTQMLANLAANSAANISVLGNITANYFIGNAAYMTGLGATYSNASASAYFLTYTGNISAGNVIVQNSVYTDTISANVGNVVTINGTGALRVPVGNASNRPSGINGYIRFNTDTPALEYYDGSMWVPITNTVTDQQITPDGNNATFTLDQTASTVGVIVSINGVLQQPTVAYSISGTYPSCQITFTETPQATDIIDVRFLGAAVTMNSTLSDDLVVSGNLTVSGNITGNVNGYTVGYKDIPQISTSNANIVLTANDGGKHYLSTTNTANVIYIPTNANVPLSTGTVITVVLQGTGNVQVVGNTGVTLYMAGNSTTGTNTRSISAYGVASILKTGTNTWFINGTGVS